MEDNCSKRSIKKSFIENRILRVCEKKFILRITKRLEMVKNVCLRNMKFNLHVFSWHWINPPLVILHIKLLLRRIWQRDQSRIHQSFLDMADRSIYIFLDYLSFRCFRLSQIWVFPLPQKVSDQWGDKTHHKTIRYSHCWLCSKVQRHFFKL